MANKEATAQDQQAARSGWLVLVPIAALQTLGLSSSHICPTLPTLGIAVGFPNPEIER